MLHPTMFNDVGPTILALFEQAFRLCSNKAIMLVQHWMMFEDVSLSLNLLKIFIQHHVTLVSFEQAVSFRR